MVTAMTMMVEVRVIVMVMLLVVIDGDGVGDRDGVGDGDGNDVGCDVIRDEYDDGSGDSGGGIAQSLSLTSSP